MRVHIDSDILYKIDNYLKPELVYIPLRIKMK